MRPRVVLLAMGFIGCLIDAACGAGPPAPAGVLPPLCVARLGSTRLRHERTIRACALSPDGKMIAAVPPYGGVVRVWDTATGALLNEIDADGIFLMESFFHGDYSFAFTPDGRMVAAAGKRDVVFWEVRSGREARRFRVGGKGIQALTFSRDGKSFYCGGGDNTLQLWDIASGKRLRSWDYFKGDPPVRLANGHADRSAVLKAVTPDGKTAVWVVERWADTGGGVSKEEGRLVTWDVAAGKDRGRIKDAGQGLVRRAGRALRRREARDHLLEK
jgi:hypothetical protein